MSKKRSLLALSPLGLFLAIYLLGSLVVGDFYKIPITVAFMFSSIYAIAISNRFPLYKRIEYFSRGASDSNLLLMLWIFVLAGAFANSAKTMGCIQATVDFTLHFLPGDMILPGLFLAACIVSLSVGTSVGTIVALTPIAVGVAGESGHSTTLLTAIIVGGSFFGDNLSFISDTTVVATSTQGCRISDKFRVNLFLAAPAAVLVLLLYFIMGYGQGTPAGHYELDFLKVIPYAVVLIVAISGMNVLAVLTTGILLTGILGIATGSFSLFGWLSSMGDGITGMGELIIITMMAGGMLEIIRENGGIDYVIASLTSHIHSKRGAELSIAALVSVVDICTANNTIAILTVGDLSKKIADQYGIDNRRCASILDTFSCCIQGLIPYGAQILIAAGLAHLNPMQIIPYLYYPMVLGIFSLIAILVRYPQRYSR